MENLTISIDKEVLTKMPQVVYEGGLQVVDTPEKARVALRELSRARIVGFDTETRPAFKAGVVHKVALMQLATDDFCFLIRLNKIGMIEPIIDFLNNSDVVKVGLSVHDDFNSLRRSAQIDPQGFIELQSFVKQFGIADNSLQKIFAIVFGKYISKGQRLTNWEAPELTIHQQHYAAIDAWACLKLYRYLSEGHFVPQDSPYIVKEENQQ